MDSDDNYRAQCESNLDQARAALRDLVAAYGPVEAESIVSRLLELAEDEGAQEALQVAVDGLAAERSDQAGHMVLILGAAIGIRTALMSLVDHLEDEESLEG